LRAQRQRLDDVGAAAKTAVDQHRHFAANGRTISGSTSMVALEESSTRPHGWRRRCRRSRHRRPLRVLMRENALEQQLAFTTSRSR